MKTGFPQIASLTFISILFIFSVMWVPADAQISIQQQVRQGDASGEIDKDKILDYTRFRQAYNRHQVGEETKELLSSVDQETRVLVFFGSWSDESILHVPGFMKAVAEADNPKLNITYIGVDSRKQDPDNLVDEHKVEKVPTFIFLRGDQEIGRITETPEESIEADMRDILR